MKRIFFLYILGLLTAISGWAQSPNLPVTASGTVQDAAHKPVAGVNIYVQEKTAGVTTDAEGKFSVSCNSNDVLIFKKEGFNTVQKAATELLGTNLVMTAALIEAGDNDNVPIPFAIRKKRSLSASISAIKGSELPQIPLSTLNNVLAGRLPGLYVKQTGTRPGTDDASFLIRGRSSYNSNQEPLVMVDGVVRDFVNMDLSEIETISVLKDAATLAWYGMNGANGVVNVTTKRGSPTATRVTFDAQGGVQMPVQMTKPLDAYNYALLYNQALANDGAAPRYDQTALDAYQNGSDPYKYPNVNWVDLLFNKAAPVQRYVATVSGGNAFARYFTLLSYYNQGGLYKNASNPKYDANANYKRYNFRTNLDLHLNKNLDVQMDVGGRVEKIRYPGSGTGNFIGAVFTTPANAFPVYNADGTYGGSSLFRTNPMALINNDGNLTDLTRTLLATINVKQKLDAITKGLSANAFYTYDMTGMFQSGYDEDYEVYEANGSSGYTRYGTKTALTYSSSTFSGNVRNNEFWGGFDYDRTFGPHGVNFSTRLQRAVSAAPGRLDNTRITYPSRLAYNFKQRYFVDVIATYAGSQNFAPSKRFGWFPAFSAGWILTEEKFLKSSGVLDYFKLRGSYGIVGNDALSARRFAYNNYFTRGGTQYFFGTGYSSVPNTTQLEVANPNLTWERAKKASVGFDARLLKQSLALSVDLFHENRTNLLTNALLPNVFGQSLVQVNAGEAEYKGWEASLNYQKTIGQWQLALNGNYTYAKSKTISVNEEAGLPAYQSSVGFPIGGVGDNGTSRFLIAEGLFQTQAEIDAAPVQRLAGVVKPGDIRYRDVNGDNVIDNLDYVMTDYNDIPTAYFGFGASLSFHGFDLSAQFQGVNGRTISINELINSGSSATGYINQFSADAWTPAKGASAPYPRLMISNRGNNTAASTYWLRSGDYLRLKAAELGYTLSTKTLHRFKLQTCRFYVSGFNLLVFSKVNDLKIDPEIPLAGYNSSYPYLRSFTAGVSLNF